METQHRLSAQVVMSHDDQSLLTSAVAVAVDVLMDPDRIALVGPRLLDNAWVIEFFILGDLSVVTEFADALKVLLGSLPVLSTLVGFTNPEESAA